MKSTLEQQTSTAPKKTFETLKEKHVDSTRLVLLESDIDSERAVNEDMASVKLDGLKSFYKMRRVWSYYLAICLATILVFDIVLVVLVGLEALTFEDDWFLRIVLGTNLVDVIGLVYLVVRFLFGKDTPENSKN